VAASPATTQALGVVRWTLTGDPNQQTLAITGYDAKNNVRSAFSYWTKRDASRALQEGGISSMVQGPASFHYANENGQVIIDQDDFAKSPDAARALALAAADFEASASAPAPAAGSVTTTSLHPLDEVYGPPIVQPGRPLVEESTCTSKPAGGSSCDDLLNKHTAALAAFGLSRCHPDGCAPDDTPFWKNGVMYPGTRACKGKASPECLDDEKRTWSDIVGTCCEQCEKLHADNYDQQGGYYRFGYCPYRASGQCDCSP
jgi:hypothetical protein